MGRMCGRRPRGRGRLVTLEARESASSGIFRANGELKEGLVDEVLAELPVEMLLFEAPTTDAQAYMLRRVGLTSTSAILPPRRCYRLRPCAWGYAPTPFLISSSSRS